MLSISAAHIPATAVTADQQALPSGAVHAGQQSVVLSRDTFTTHNFGGNRIDALQAVLQNPQDIAHLHIYEKWGTSNYSYEIFPQEYLDGNILEIEFPSWQQPYVSPYWSATIEVRADIDANAKPGDTVGLGQMFVSASSFNWWYWGGDAAPVHYAGAQNPAYTVAGSQSADLSVALSGPATVTQGNTLSYSLTAHNSGPGTADNVVATMALPAGATLDVADSSPGVSVQEKSVVWHPADLVSGQTAMVSVAFNTSGISVPAGMATAVVERATITSSTQDPNSSNNTSNSVVTTIVKASNDLTVDFGNAPPANSVLPNQANIDLGTLHIDTTNGAIDIQSMYLGIEEHNSDNSLVANVALDVYNPVLRNVVTGQTVQTVSVGSANGLQIYRASNFVVNKGDEWKILDSRRGGVNGEMMRADVIVSAPGVQTAFWGLTSPSTVYDLQAKDVATGSTVTTVKPGGMINGNNQTVVVPELDVAEQNIGSMDTAVKNQKNIVVSRFQAQGKGLDELLTSATFTALQGSLLDGTNYALWVDTDGDGIVDTILQKGITAQNGVVSVDNIAGGGYVVPADTTVYFELHMDVAGSLSTNVLQVGLSSVQSELVSNGASSQVTLTNGTPKTWHFQSQGSLFVSRDTQPRQRQLLAGAVGDEILRLQLRAQNEDVDVTTLRLLAVGDGAQSIDALLLYKLGETSPFATMTVGATGSDVVPTTYNGQPATAFSAVMNNQQLVVKDGQVQTFSVVPRMKSDEQGAESGTSFYLVMYDDNVINNQTGEGAVHARGLFSGNSLLGNNGDNVDNGEVFIGTDTATPNADIVSPTNTVVLSKITSITNANPDPDNTNVPVGVSPIGQFTMTTATNDNTYHGLNKAAPNDLVFTVYATNVGLDTSSFEFYNKNDPSVKVAATSEVETSPGVYQVEFDNLVQSLVDTRINSGASETFVLEANITNSKTTTSVSTLYVSLAPSSIKWYDMDIQKTLITGVEYGDTIVKSTIYRS
ncbi:MAG TPA: hypothetical protein VHA78_05820 [Candidatus Peribacteraceae bacterium]|nr:hypothetical protein [Candidatus Peribacteraceae bacterium]